MSFLYDILGSTFLQSGIVKVLKMHCWSLENSHISPQKMIRETLVNERLVWYTVNPNCSTHFLRWHLIGMIISSMSLSNSFRVWFKEDVAPPHKASNLRLYANTEFCQQTIGYGGPVEWPGVNRICFSTSGVTSGNKCIWLSLIFSLIWSSASSLLFTELSILYSIIFST